MGKKLTLKGLFDCLTGLESQVDRRLKKLEEEKWVKVGSLIFSENQWQTNVNERLKALEEWKENFEKEQSRHEEYVASFLKGASPSVSAFPDPYRGMAPSVVEDIKRYAGAQNSNPYRNDPVKLPCTTCKHYRMARNPFDPMSLLPSWLGGRSFSAIIDECSIGGYPLKHLVDGPENQFCNRNNSDKLCKYHSERNK